VSAGSNWALLADLHSLGAHIKCLGVEGDGAEAGGDGQLRSLRYRDSDLAARCDSDWRAHAEWIRHQCQAFEGGGGGYARAYLERSVSSRGELGSGYIADSERGAGVSMERGGVYGEEEGGKSEEGEESLHCKKSM
jgi:hypothetical protein